MSSACWVLIAVNVLLLVERYVSWHLLWQRYLERERRADQLFDRMMVLKGLRPIAEPKLENPQPQRPVLTQDEMDGIQDRIKERLEVATLRGEALTPSQAEAEVWATLGYPNPPIS